MAKLLDQLERERKAERARVASEAAERAKAGAQQLARENAERELATIAVRLDWLAKYVDEAAELEKRRKQLKSGR